MEDEYCVMIPQSLAEAFIGRTDFFCPADRGQQLMQQVAKKILDAKDRKEKEEESEKTEQDIMRVVLHLSEGEKLIWAARYSAFRERNFTPSEAVMNAAEEIRRFRIIGDIEFGEDDPNLGNKYYDDMIGGE